MRLSAVLAVAVLVIAQPTGASSFSWAKFQAEAKKEAKRMEKAAKIAGTKVENAVAEEAQDLAPKIKEQLKRGKAWADKETAQGLRNRVKHAAKRLEKRAQADVEKDKQLQTAEDAWRKQGAALLVEQKNLEQQEMQVASMETQLKAARSIGGGSTDAIAKQEEELNAKEAALMKARQREEHNRRAWRNAGEALRWREEREDKAWSALDEEAATEESHAGTIAKGAAMLGLSGSSPASAEAAKELEADRKQWKATREKLGGKARRDAAKSLEAAARVGEKKLRANDAEVDAAELARGAEELARLRRAARAARAAFVDKRSAWRSDAKAIVKVAAQALQADVRAAHGDGGSAAALVRRMDKMVVEWGLASSEIDDLVRRLDTTRKAVSAMHRVLKGITKRASKETHGHANAGKKAAKLRESELEHVRAAGDGWEVDDKELKALAKSWEPERTKTQRDVNTHAKQAMHDFDSVDQSEKRASATAASKAKVAALEQQLQHERTREHDEVLGGTAVAALVLVFAAVLLVKMRKLRRELRQRSNGGFGVSESGGSRNESGRPAPYSDAAPQFSVGPTPPAPFVPPDVHAAEIEMGSSGQQTQDKVPPRDRDDGSGFSFMN